MAYLKKGQMPPGFSPDKFAQTFGRKMYGRTPSAINTIPEFSALKEPLSKLLKPSVGSHEFLPMHIRINGNDMTGQTILRNVGLGTRTERNLNIIKRAVGCAELSDPATVADVLAALPVDLHLISFNTFRRLRIDTPLYTGKGSGFLFEATRQYRELGVSPSRSFYYLMLSMGIDRRDQTLEPEQLKEVLDSAGYDFGSRFIYLTDFMRMKFTSPHLRTCGRNRGIITGQSLLNRYGGKGHGCSVKTLERVLRDAGYARPDLSSPEAIRSILASAEKQVDWTAVRFNDFKLIRFNAPMFIGIGSTWLRQAGDSSARTMRKLLKRVGIVNNVFSRWATHIK